MRRETHAALVGATLEDARVRTGVGHTRLGGRAR
jgi:hypothetical protein